MEKMPESGTDSALHSTFRLIYKDGNSSRVSSPADAIGKSVMLEPFDLPGMVVMQQGPNGDLTLANPAEDKMSSIFHVVEGLDGKDDTFSLESENQKGYFVYTGVNYNAGIGVKLKCNSGSTDTEFRQGASFVFTEGISEYHPISFVAKGARRNFLMVPLLSLRDESYSVYFKLGV